MLVPLPAASITTAMMLLPSTRLSGVRPKRTWQGKRPATPTNFAAARACRPSLLMMVISQAGMSRCILLAEVAVANLKVFQLRLERLPQAFSQVDRAGMAAGTADGDGHVGAIAGSKAWQPLVQVRMDVGVHLIHIGLGRQVVDHRLIQP